MFYFYSAFWLNPKNETVICHICNHFSDKITNIKQLNIISVNILVIIVINKLIYSSNKGIVDFTNPILMYYKNKSNFH